MKKIIAIYISVLFINPSFSQTIAQEDEIKLILNTIEKETDCYYNRDIDCYSSHWSNSELSFLTYNNSDGSVHAARGYENITTGVRKHFENNPKDKKLKSKRNIIRQNIEYEFFSPTTAYVMWDQYNENRISKTYTYSSETRLMKKEGGAWKILNITALWDYTYYVNSTLLESSGEVSIIDRNKSKKDQDMAAIKKVLHSESSAYYDRDYESWANNWVQNETISHTWNNKDGGYTSVEGWKNLSERFGNDMKENPEIIYPNFYVSNLNIVVSGNHATVKSDEYIANKTGDMYTKATGLKTFLKVDGNWKVESVSSFWDYDYKYSKAKVEMIVKD